MPRRAISSWRNDDPAAIRFASGLPTVMKTDDRRAALRAEINHQTSRFPWKELLRFFASGNVITVDDALDLIEAGVCVADDDKESITKWMADGKIAKVSDAQAEAWLKTDVALWTVVVKPWILVQERKDSAAH